MMSAILLQLLYCFCVLSALLLVGTLLRALVPAFQKLFLPASVLGGFVGLLGGPIIWRTAGLNFGIPFPDDWIAIWAALPGILMVPVVASVPLGMGRNGDRKTTARDSRTTVNVLRMFAILYIASGVQILLGIVVREVFNAAMPSLELYKPFGYELAEGFAGGHGTAGVIGNYYKDLGLPYWELAQGLTATSATAGLLGGMIIGIIALNVSARHGKTALLARPAEIPQDIRRGFPAGADVQKSLGRETTYNSSIESLSFHLAVILSGCGAAYIIMNLVKTNNVPVINQLPIWVYAIVVMFIANAVLQRTKLRALIDKQTKGRITGTLSDYAITAAIASLPVQGIIHYILPLGVLTGLGLLCTYFAVFGLSKRVFKDYPVERGLSVWGTMTGVFFTGLMLLKLCDPDYKSPVLQDYSLSFSMTTLSGFILMPVTVGFLVNQGFLANIALQGGITLAALVLLLLAGKLSRSRPGRRE